MSYEVPKADRKITELFKERFTLSVEVVPPRNGVPPSTIYKQVETLVEAGADFLAVTKGAGGSLRGGSLPIAQVIKEQFARPCIAHFTCRDLLPVEVENQLVDHHFVGIRNILALRGDPPMGVEETSREGSHLYAYQLVEQIRALNHGEYLQREGFETKSSEPMDFCIGVACYPDANDRKQQIAYLQRKVEAGASFAITQMLLGSASYERFVDDCARHHIHIPILPGTCVFKSREQAARLAHRFELEADLKALASLPEKDGPIHHEAVIANFERLVEGFKRCGAPGLHAFLIGSEMKTTADALRAVHAEQLRYDIAR